MLFEAVVDNDYVYSDCATCHSSQGASVKGNITIHEYNLRIASREWVGRVLRAVLILEKSSFTTTRVLIKKWIEI